MDSFSELAKTRRSTRKFTGELLAPGQVELILRAGLMSPSSKCSTPWQFVVVEDKDMLLRLSRCKPQGAKFLEGCALAIAVCANVMESEAWTEDATIAALMMQLQAEDLGLGSCWCQIRGRQTEDEGDSTQYVRDLLGIPYQIEVLCVIGIGHKAHENKPFDETRLQWEKVHLGSFSHAAPQEPHNSK
ncbi:MAG: nitroreductase family protein [Tannerellaceae bacterium]|jgi:nitroreductase|nr:nitroreductase family protein [Tannerellaceae bacterium]